MEQDSSEKNKLKMHLWFHKITFQTQLLINIPGQPAQMISAKPGIYGTHVWENLRGGMIMTVEGF